jgi:hypothetical protein
MNRRAKQRSFLPLQLARAASPFFDSRWVQHFNNTHSHGGCVDADGCDNGANACLKNPTKPPRGGHDGSLLGRLIEPWHII